MQRLGPSLGLILLAATLAGCGCDTIGYPALDVTVQDRVTGRPVPLGGAEIRAEADGQPRLEQRWPAADTTSRFTVCCLPGLYRVRIAKAGYAPLDTTVRVRSTGGQCPRPRLLHLVARLQPSARTIAVGSVVPVAVVGRPGLGTMSHLTGASLE